MIGEFELLVVGGGAAGLAATRGYRAAGGEGAVGLVSDEHRVPYNRPPLTKEFLRGESEEDELPIEEEGWLAEHCVSLVSGRAVTLDPDERSVVLSGGRELRYRKCVLATGAEPTRLPVAGADDPAVRVIRTLDHVRELTWRLRGGDPVVVIGSGFIGCEIAASLRRRGHSVTLVSDEEQPNFARLDVEPAERIHRWLDEEGVISHLGTPVDEIIRRSGSLEIVAGDVRAVAKIVVMAAGVAPRSELAGAAGLELRDGALPANSAMRTAKEAGSLLPPKHILNAPTRLMKSEGYGSGYEYDHDAEDAFSGQDYFPEKLGRHKFYDPPERGFEREIKKRLEYWAKLRKERGAP